MPRPASTAVSRELSNTPTVTKLRVISRHQQLIRLDFEDRFQDIDAGRLLAEFRRGLPDCDVVVFSDYGKGTLTDVAAMIVAARQAGKPVLVDPKAPDFSRYRGTSVITPNLAEFEPAAGPCADEQSLRENGRELLASYGIEALLVTRGEQGMTLLRRSETPLHLPAETREVFDVTGAGDTVIAVLAAALAAGADLPGATALANLAAGIVVGKLGTASVSLPELQRAVRQGPGRRLRGTDPGAAAGCGRGVPCARRAYRHDQWLLRSSACGTCRLSASGTAPGGPADRRRE